VHELDLCVDECECECMVSCMISPTSSLGRHSQPHRSWQLCAGLTTSAHALRRSSTDAHRARSWLTEHTPSPSLAHVGAQRHWCAHACAFRLGKERSPLHARQAENARGWPQMLRRHHLAQMSDASTRDAMTVGRGFVLLRGESNVLVAVCAGGSVCRVRAYV
jgi:hypothetical protein